MRPKNSPLARKEPPQALSLEETHRLIAVAEQHDETLGLLTRLLLETGARISEALALRPVDIGPGEVLLPRLKSRRRPGEKPPTKACVISPDLEQRLRDYIARRQIRPDWPIFASPRDPRRPLSRQTAWRLLKKIAAEAGVLKVDRWGTLSPAWPHVLRHSTAVHLLLSGLPAPLVQEQLGHAKLTTTQAYFRVADETRRRLIQQALERARTGQDGS